MQLTLLALVAVAAAQNYSFPQGFDINKVEMGTRCTLMIDYQTWIQLTSI